MIGLLVALAGAAPIQVLKGEDGSVTGVVEVGAAPDAVMAVLSDVGRAFERNPDTRLVRAEPRGRCTLVEVETPGLTSRLRYTALRCPTERGFSVRLLDSDAYRRNDVTWIVEPTDGGTRVVVRVLVDVDLPVPDALIESRLVSSVKEELARLAQEVAE